MTGLLGGGARGLVPDPVFLVNAGVRVSDTSPFTTIIQIPPNVRADGGQLSLRNMDTVATMYFKWVNIGESALFDVTAAGIVLPAGIGWDTRIVPPGKALVGRSSVNLAVCAVEIEALLR